jgi:hypothetical protein
LSEQPGQFRLTVSDATPYLDATRYLQRWLFRTFDDQGLSQSTGVYLSG